MITHPENISSKHNPVSRHEHHRVAISVSPRRGMDDFCKKTSSHLDADPVPIGNVRISDLYTLEKLGESRILPLVSMEELL